jgi:hypothetical protein
METTNTSITSFDEFEDFINSSETSGGGFINSEDKKKKKFKPEAQTETIRLVKFEDGSFAKILKFHNPPFNGNPNEKQMVLCLGQHGKECPLCAYEKQILKKQYSGNYNSLSKEEKDHNTKVFKESLQFRADIYYLFKIIDRGSSKNYKFWLIKQNHKKEGVVDKLTPLIKTFKTKYNGIEITDEQYGADVIITTVEDSWMGRKYRKVSALQLTEPTPAYRNQQEKEQLMSNLDVTWEKVWEEIKAPEISSTEYAELLILKQAPYWDKNAKRFRYPHSPEIEEKVYQSYIKNRSNDNSNNVDSVSDYDSEVMSTFNVQHTSLSSGGATSENQMTKSTNENPEIVNQHQSNSVISDSEIDDLPF